MTTPSRSPALRFVAVAALFTFGCAVVRAPATGMSEVIPVRDGAADPQLALWVEGGEAPTAAETAEATQRARTALSEAARGLEGPDGDLLVIRAQGVTRTKGRRANQVAGAVGLVVGAAVIVVVAIVALSQGKGGGGGGKASGAHAAPRPGGGGGGVRPAPLPVPARAPRFSPAPPPFAPRFPHDGVAFYGDPAIHFGLYFDLSGPVPYVPPREEAGFPQPLASYGATPAMTDEGDDLAFEPEAPEPVSEVRLSVPAPLPLDQRGFFAGDELAVELVAVDRLTGEPRLRKVARRSVDPTNAVEVRKFLRRALAEGAWEPVTATAH